MKVKGCGKRGVELTFYRVRGMLVSRRRVPPLTCGERAESRAGRGVLLCPDCADLHGLKPGKSVATYCGESRFGWRNGHYGEGLQHSYPTCWSLVVRSDHLKRSLFFSER
jgi:hypothetical protein